MAQNLDGNLKVAYVHYLCQTDPKWLAFSQDLGLCGVPDLANFALGHQHRSGSLLWYGDVIH
jgi:hypothetical protein